MSYQQETVGVLFIGSPCIPDAFFFESAVPNDCAIIEAVRAVIDRLARNRTLTDHTLLTNLRRQEIIDQRYLQSGSPFRDRAVLC